MKKSDSRNDKLNLFEMINLQLPNVDGKEPNRRSVVVMDSENVTLGKRQTDIGYCRMGIILGNGLG